jgi:hypothetical protein
MSGKSLLTDNLGSGSRRPQRIDRGTDLFSTMLGDYDRHADTFGQTDQPNAMGYDLRALVDGRRQAALDIHDQYTAVLRAHQHGASP